MYIYPIIRQSVSAVTSRYGLGGITPGGSMHSPDPRASTVRDRCEVECHYIVQYPGPMMRRTPINISSGSSTNENLS
ncbi:Protein of unknown function [Pyronema omphalodes CBS 100304]|nr:Protein of unknown function [Pyronema omphalodes CBS 100304]